MKFYRCDICGEVIYTNDPHAEYGSKHRYAHSGLFGEVVQNKDVCGSCMRIAKGMDFEKIVLERWEQMAKTLAEVEEERIPQENVICENCGAVMKRDDGIILTTDPPQYLYRCENCGNTTSKWVND